LKRQLGLQGQQARSVTRTLLAIGALIAVLVVVPLLLISEGGSPVPRGGLHRLWVVLATHQGFDTHIVTSWLVHGALLLAWVAWAWMAVCIVIEIHSWATGRSPTRLPGSRTMQAMAACLVGTSLAMISMATTLPTSTPGPRASTFASTARTPGILGLRVIDDYGFGMMQPIANGAPPSDAVLSSLETPDTPHREPSSGAMFEAERQPVPGRVHTVSGRETLWSIAEDQLGSARRWRELADLNYSVRQNDGQALTKSHWVKPGWKLVLPPPSITRSGPEADFDAVDSTAELSAFGTAQPGGVKVGTPTAKHGIGDPNGWIAEAQRMGEAPLPLVGAGLLGAGVVSLLSRMRRAQQRRRAEGGLIKLPNAALAAMERRLRIGGGEDILRAIDESLKLFRQVCIERGTVVPVVRGIEAHSDHIELVLDRPIDPGTIPRLFEVRSGRPSAFIAKEEIFSTLAGGHNPFPALVSIGNGPNGPQLVNVEAIGSLALVGEPTDCEGVVRALALEMATSHWAGQFDLVLVGFGNELTRFDRVASSSDLEMVLHRVRFRRSNGEALLRSSSYGSFSHARTFEDSDTWDPLIVICGPRDRSAEYAELVSAASDPRTGLAIIAPGSGHMTSRIWNVSNNQPSPSIDFFSSVAVPQRVTSTEFADIGELVDTARDFEPAGTSTQPYVSLSIPMPSQPPGSSVGRHEDANQPDPKGAGSEVDRAPVDPTAKGIDVEVSVLGPVGVRGAEHEFTRAWAKELVVYLAMHPNGASNDAWATALWPDRLMASSSLHSTASVARRSLGHDRDGRDHLPKAHGRLRLAGSVGTDWGRFVVLADGNSAGQWREALELVRGRLFDGLRSSDWPILEGIAPAMEATIVDVAGRLAGTYLQQGDAGGAEWAARKGLLVSPYDERLYRMLLRAADSAGNPAGVESVMSELVRLVADDVEPFDSVHPSTMDLYRSLSRRKTLATSQR